MSFSDLSGLFGACCVHRRNGRVETVKVGIVEPIGAKCGLDLRVACNLHHFANGVPFIGARNKKGCGRRSCAKLRSHAAGNFSCLFLGLINAHLGLCNGSLLCGDTQLRLFKSLLGCNKLGGLPFERLLEPAEMGFHLCVLGGKRFAVAMGSLGNMQVTLQGGKLVSSCL